MPSSIQTLSTAFALRSFATLISLAAVSFAFTLGAAPASAETHISWSWGRKMIRGSGNVVTLPVATAAFDQVSAQDGIRVVLRRGSVQKVSVKTDDNLQALVEAKVDGPRPLLRMKPNSTAHSESGVEVMFDYMSLNALALRDGARGDPDVAGGSTFRADARDGSSFIIAQASANEFELSMSDGASAAVTRATASAWQRYKVVDGAQLTVIDATSDRVVISVADGANMTLRMVNAKRIDVSVADGARLDVAGVAQQQNFSLTDGAEVNAVRLQGISAQVRAADGSSLKLGVVQSLNADMQDGSTVRYAGDPAVTMNTRDGSSVRKI